MKLMIALILLLALPGFARKGDNFEYAKLTLIAKAGVISLKNQNRELKSINNFDNIYLSFEKPQFSSLGTLISSNQFLLKVDNDIFVFKIPRSQVTSTMEFKIAKKRTGQNYHIQAKNESRILTSAVSEQKNIYCSWTTTNSYLVSGTDANGNSTSTWQDDVTTHSGSQDAIVEDRIFEERKVIVIYDEINQLRLRTEFVKRQDRRVVKTLSNCR